MQRLRSALDDCDARHYLELIQEHLFVKLLTDEEIEIHRPTVT
jgi:hypothetical protein